MKKKNVKVTDIIRLLGDAITSIDGDVKDAFVDNIADMAHVNETTLDWVKSTNQQKQQVAEQSKANVLLVDENVAPIQGKLLIHVSDPKMAIMKVIREYFYEKPMPGVHNSSYVHPEAVIGEKVYIGPDCYIGKCKIGDNNIIHSGVHIYDRTVIGSNNVIHSGAVICVDGLGCVRHEDGKLEEFPQLGGVIIGDNCYIGANTHIASGSLSDTIIENGCKINGMTFIGSNDILHENVWITGSTMLAGSVEVGRNTSIFSKAVVRDWCKIGEGCTIGMGAVVTKNVPSGETWVGNPARKMEKKN